MLLWAIIVSVAIGLGFRAQLIDESMFYSKASLAETKTQNFSSSFPRCQIVRLLIWCADDPDVIANPSLPFSRPLASL
jgi:hypothetical protein